MKAVFFISKENYSPDQLDKIAEKYATTVHIADDGVNRFILVKPKLQIKEQKEEDKYSFNVWGATQEDINFFKSILPFLIDRKNKIIKTAIKRINNQHIF